MNICLISIIFAMEKWYFAIASGMYLKDQQQKKNWGKRELDETCAKYW